MPIDSSNDLPHMTIKLGKTRDGASLNVLFDTGAALTTGLLSYHMWVKLHFPSSVHSYESFDGASPFDPITLTGAIVNPASDNCSPHGTLSAVIRYFTPYTDVTGKRLLFSVALGTGMTVNTILGNAQIRQWGLTLHTPDYILSDKLKETFQVQYKPTSRLCPTLDTSSSQLSTPIDATTTTINALINLSANDSAAAAHEAPTNAWG